MKLGKVQLSVLRILSERPRGWIDHTFGPGWVWGSVGSTRRTLESLVKKGLVKRIDYKDDCVSHCYQYLISEHGIKLLEDLGSGKESL